MVGGVVLDILEPALQLADDADVGGHLQLCGEARVIGLHGGHAAEQVFYVGVERGGLFGGDFGAQRVGETAGAEVDPRTVIGLLYAVRRRGEEQRFGSRGAHYLIVVLYEVDVGA